MKKVTVISLLTTIFFVATGASADEIIVSGNAKRVAKVVAYLERNGCKVAGELDGGEVMGTLKGKPWPGVQVSSAGNSDIFVPISDEVLRTGLCSDQTKLLDAICPPRARVTSAPKQHLPVADKAPAPYCPDGSCWPPNPQGKYLTLEPYQGIRVSRNIDPDKWENVISVKVEGYKTKIPRQGWPYGSAPVWGPTFVVRNVRDIEIARRLIEDPRALSYVNCIWDLIKRSGRTPQYDGEVCYEVTFGLDGVPIEKNAPPECPQFQ